MYEGARTVRSVHLLDDGGTLFTSKTRTHPLALDDILTEPPAPQQGHVTINEADLIVADKPFPVLERTPAVRSLRAPCARQGLPLEPPSDDADFHQHCGLNVGKAAGGGAHIVRVFAGRGMTAR